MFVLRQLNSKINTNFISISVVCIILLLVIGIFSSGYSLQNVFYKDLEDQVPYDFILVEYNETNKDIYERLPNNLKQYWKEYSEVTIYSSEKSFNYGDFNLDFSGVPFDISNIPVQFITLSDYNNMMEIQKSETISLDSNQYAINTIMNYDVSLAKQFVDKNIAFDFEDKKIEPSTIILTGKLSNTEFGGLTFIVPDNFEETLRSTTTSFINYLNVTETDESEATKIENSLKEYLSEERGEGAFAYFVSKHQLYTSSVSTKVIVSFLAIYLGVVFMITCGAILAIHQLSEAADNKDRYALLAKLGAERSMINKALFIQILCYFLAPLSLAVVHSFAGLRAANDVIKQFGNVDIGSTLVVTVIFIIIVYSIYFLLTYIGSKNIIEK